MTASTIRVLHVDDDQEFADLTAACLAREDDRIEVRTAASPADGLELLAEKTVDCVVSDYDMPGTNGIGFLESVREAHPNLPFILYTGKGSEAVAADAIAAGVTDYLRKDGGTGQYAILANRIRNATRQARAERDRERIREQMELALEETNSLVFEVDLETSEVSRHGAVDLFFDVDADTIPTTADFVERVVHPDDRQRFQEFFRRLQTSDANYDTIDYRTNPETGSVRWLRGSIHLDTDRRAIGIAQDITDEKQMERELRAERDLVAGIVETSPVGIAVVTPDGELSFVNDRAEEIYGRSAETITDFSHDDPRWDLVDEQGDSLEEGRTPFDRVLSRREPIRDQVIGIRRPSGRRIWLSVNGAPQWDENGDLKRAVFAFEDVTEQRELGDELGEIFGRITDAFYALDDEFRFTHVNERAEELLRASEAELIGEELWELYPEAAEVDEVRDAFHEAQATQESRSYELYYEPLEFWVEATVYPSETGVSVYFRDITDRKERERELKRENDRLTELTGVVSHDLRSPLNVAEGRVELARTDCDSEHLDSVEEALDRMRLLIEDVLALAREGTAVTDPEPLDLGTVVEDCWATVETADASLVVDVDRTVRAERSRLRQVFENLIRNSVEHGSTDSRPGGDDAVTVTVGELEDGFYVEDDGRGIPPDIRADVLTPGYSTKSDGTGFGLGIVKQIIEAHGWRIALTDGSEGGARFEITGVDPVSDQPPAGRGNRGPYSGR